MKKCLKIIFDILSIVLIIAFFKIYPPIGFLLIAVFALFMGRKKPGEYDGTGINISPNLNNIGKGTAGSQGIYAHMNEQIFNAERQIKELQKEMEEDARQGQDDN